MTHRDPWAVPAGSPDSPDFPAAADRPVRVLHVCTGNICRSPMAEHIMRRELAARFGPGVDVQVRSAGTYGGHDGQPMNDAAARTLRSAGIDPAGFTAKWLREPQVDWADLVLTATAGHRGEVLRLQPRALRRTFTLRELARLAAHVRSADLPAGTAGQRLAALVGTAAQLRGLHPPAVPTADDIDDPYGAADGVFAKAAEAITGAVRGILAVL